MGDVVRLKVFGERNCGTNLAQRILAPVVEVLPAGAPPRVRRAARRLGGRRETVLDLWDSAVRGSTLGWKHAYIDDATVRRLRARGIAAVALTRHPLSWLVSLRRRPYHVLPVAGSDALAHQRLGRERLPSGPHELIDVWQLKTERYRELAAAGDLVLLRFEDLVAGPAETLTAALESLGIAAGELAVPEQSVKRDTRSSDDIRAYYAQERWRAEATGWDVEQVARVPTDLMDALGYRP